MFGNYVVSIWNRDKHGSFTRLIRQFRVHAKDEQGAYQWAINQGFKSNNFVSITVN